MQLELAAPGEAIGGSRYRVLRRLGSGGMADVDLALQSGVAGSTRLCVLKSVREDLAERSEFVSMFFEEARISAALSHPNVVHIYEVGGNEQDCFLAMEFLRGRSFAHVQRASLHEPFDYAVALEVLIATLSGLEHIHGCRDLNGAPLRLVHRDISPPNVFVTYEGEVKILDFGVAKSKDSLVQTQAGILKGKVGYMAPELVAAKPLDARADLYAVGVMLWEATAGRDRWGQLNEMAILAKLARGGPVELPAAVERGLPALADAICLRALAPDPAQRYQSAAELRSDLIRLAEAVGRRPDQASLRQYMGERFAADRRREESQIDQALQRLRSSVRPNASEEEHGASTKRVVHRASAAPAAESAPATTPVATPRSRASLAVVLVAAVVVAALLLARSLATPPASVEAATQPATPTSSGAAPAPRPEKPETKLPASVEAPHPEGPALAVPKLTPSKLRHAAPAPKPAAPAPASSRKLQIDRQDPWQE